MVRFYFGFIFIFLTACDTAEQPDKTVVLNEASAPEILEPHDLDYYTEHPNDADAIIEICDKTPSQARSEILEGNCSFAQKSMLYRGYNDK